MSIMQRRKSARLASTIDALTNDLEPKEIQTSVDENMSPDAYWGGKAKGDDAIQLLGQQKENFEQSLDGDDENFEQSLDGDDENFEQSLDGDDENFEQSLDGDDEKIETSGAFDDKVTIESDDIQGDDQDQFDAAFDEAMGDEDGDEASIFEGDPGVKDFGSESTKDTDSVRGLGKGYGIDFDGDDRLEPSIRKIPGRTEKQARIKKLISRIENVANICEKRGRKALAYRLDIVCNYLESKYLNK